MEETAASFLDRLAESSASKPGPYRVNAGLVALVEILEKIQREPYHWPVGRTSFQKLAYFAMEAGLPTGLTHTQGSYGPYSPELRATIVRLVNNGLIHEERFGRMFRVVVGPTFIDARRVYQDELTHFDAIIDRVSDLFLRINGGQAELAATVHFVASKLTTNLHRSPSEHEVLDGVMEWKRRRRPPINQAEVGTAVRDLAALGWIRAEASSDLPIDEDLITAHP